MSKPAAAPTDKKPGGPAVEHAPKPAAAPSGGSSKGSVGAKVGCHATGCKDKDKRFNFCDEHFQQFKFGLITKAGDQVSDYEKKFEHYQNWLKAQSKSRGKVA